MAVRRTAGASYAYVANESGDKISYYTVNDSGKLTAASSSPFTIAGQFTCLVLSSNGNYLYAIDQANSQVDILARGSGGSLTQVGTQATGTSPVTATLDAIGSYLLVANEGTSSSPGSISVFSVNNSTGGLQQVSNFSFATGNPVHIAVSKSGNFVYAVTNNNLSSGSGGSLYTFTFGGGTLTQVGSAITESTESWVTPSFIAITPDTSFLCVVDSSSTHSLVYAFDIGSTGALTARSVPSFTAGGQPKAAVFDSSSTYLYVANKAGTLNVITWNNGIPSQSSSVATGSNPVYVALSPSGTALYVVDQGAYSASLPSSTPSQISQYSVSDETVTLLSTIATGTTAVPYTGPSWIVFK